MRTERKSGGPTPPGVGRERLGTKPGGVGPPALAQSESQTFSKPYRSPDPNPNKNDATFTNNTTGTVGSVVQNGGTFANNGKVLGKTTVNFGSFNNLADATLNILDMFGGTVTNEGGIGTMSYYDGTFNGASGSITTLNIFGDSTGIDWGNVGTTNVKNGAAGNANNNTLGTVTLDEGGTLANTGTVTVAKVNQGGTLDNLDGGNITLASVNDGKLNNAGNVTNMMFQSGGIVDNAGTINSGNISGGTFNNTGNVVTNTTVSGGTFTNKGSVTGETKVSGGDFTNNTGYVESAEVYGEGTLVNSFVFVDGAPVRGRIDDVTVWGGGTFTNRGGTVGNTTTLFSGAASPAMRSARTMASANTGSKLENIGGRFEGTTTINTGDTLLNTNLDFEGYLLPGEIDNLQMRGGTFTNEASVTEMTFFGGSVIGAKGTLGSLTIAGRSDADNNFGNVTNLAFDTTGNGYMTISGFAEGNAPSFSSNMNVSNVDLTGGNLILAMSDVFAVDGNDLIGSFMSALGFNDDGNFYLSQLLGDLFGTSNVNDADELTSFEVSWGEGYDSFWLINDGQFGEDWNYASDTGLVTWENWESDGNSVPEPATLVMLGLGLAGLGLARRRK